MASAAENLRNQTKTELIELLKSAKISDVSETNLTNDMIKQGMTSSAVRPSELRQEIQAKAYEYQTNVFYSVVFVTLKNLKDKLQSIYIDYYNPDDRKSRNSMIYRNCLAKYYEFQNYFNKINSGLTAKLEAKSYEDFCKYLDIGSEIQKLQKEFDAVVDKVPPIPPEEEAGAAGPDPSVAPQPAATDPSAASTSPAAPQSAPSPSPAVPQPATAQPTVAPYPVPPSGADKSATIDKYFSYDFDFMPDLDSYITFKKDKKINPGSPEAISHAEEWILFYDQSVSRFQSDLDDYKINGKSDSDFENKKKIFNGNLYICNLFREFWTVVYRIQNQIEPFYKRLKEKKFEGNSSESEDYEKLCIASKRVVDFYLDIERKVNTELLNHDPVLTKDNLFNDTKIKQFLENYSYFEKQLEVLSPSPPGPAGGSNQPPQAQPASPAASSVPPKPGVGSVDVSETVLFDPAFNFFPGESVFLQTNVEVGPGSLFRIDNAKKWLAFFADICQKMKRLEKEVRKTEKTDQDFALKLSTVLNNFVISDMFQKFWQGLLNIHSRIKFYHDKIRNQKFDDTTPEYKQYKEITVVFNDILVIIVNAEHNVGIVLGNLTAGDIIKREDFFSKDSLSDYQTLNKKLIQLTPLEFSDSSSSSRDASKQPSSSDQASQQSSSSNPYKSVTNFSRRSARPDPTDVAELRELLEKTREWGMQMRAAAQENYRIAQKVREFFGPGYEFGEPNKKEPGYDDPPFD